MIQDFLSLARRLERAQATHNDKLNRAAGGESHPLGGGFAHWRGPGHPLNQALGLVDPVTGAELEAAEAFLGRGGHPVVLELSPAADPGLWPLLASRGYALHQFQQLWVRDLGGELPGPGRASIRRAAPSEAGLLSRVVGAGFADQDDWDQEPAFGVSLDVEGIEGYLAWVDGEPAGGAMVGLEGGVALLGGAAVLPRFRGRGLQKALLTHRLARAKAGGCDLACASTLPGTASQHNCEACGFGAGYPKVEMISASPRSSSGSEPG